MTRGDDSALVSMSERERRQLFAAAFSRVEEMVRGVPDHDVNFSEERVKTYKEDMLYRINLWLLNEMFNDVRNRGDNVRVVNALLNSMGSGNLVCENIFDLGLFEHLFRYRLYHFSSEVEHFADKGELLDVLKLLMDDVDKQDEQGELSIADIETLLRLGMFRIYDYDMTLENHEELPLEVRIEFSGVFDRNTDFLQRKTENPLGSSR